jgi:hypothetical protein
MNKLTPAFVLGAGLAFALATPNVQADPIIQTINPTAMTAAQFNSLFQPISSAPVMTSTYDLYGYSGAPETGIVQSQVFQGTGAAAGSYAYAYQIGVNANATSSNGVPAHIDSASFVFNGTPVGTDFTNSGNPSYGYVIKDAQIGGLNLPQAAPGGVIQAPSTLSWQPGANIGVIRAQYVDPNLSAPPLNPGANSATFVLISTQPFTTQPVNLGSSVPTVGGLTSVYAAEGGQIQPIPIPEPSTLLAWAGMAGAVALVRQVRKNRRAAA